MATAIEWTNKVSVLAAVRQWPAIFREEIMHALRLSAEVLISETKTLTPVGTGESGGNLANSITAGEPVATARGFKVQYGTPLAHAEVIEKGRKPGSRMPPPGPIARWLWIKRNMFPDLADATSERDPQIRSAAWLIARKIGARGFASAPDGPGKGWGMFRRGVAAGKPTVIAVFAECRKRIESRCQAGV